MTISSDSYQSIPAPVVRSNLELLGTFEKGEKPITRGVTLLKEDRYIPTIRRAWEGAFDSQVIVNTFRSARDICEKAKNPYLFERPEDLMREAKGIQRVVIKSLQGLKMIENSYRKEAEIVYFNAEKKLLTANKLKRVYETYHPIFTPRKRSVSALISVFDDGKSAKHNTVKSSHSREKKERQKVSARQFWQKQEQKKPEQPARKRSQKEKIKTPEQRSNTVFDDSSVESHYALSTINKQSEPPPSPPPLKISVKKRRVTTILRRMAQETLDKVRLRRKKKKKPYKEKSFIRTYTQGSNKTEGSMSDELKAIFAEKSNEISRQYEYFDSYQEDLKKRKLQKGKQAQVQCFDLNLLSRVVDNYDEPPSDDVSDGSSHNSWNDRDEDVMSMRREVIYKAQSRPLSRSISVYPGTLHKNKKTHQIVEIKPSSMDDNFIERLKQIRTFTEYSDSGEDRTEDDYFSDEDPFGEDILK